MYVCVCLHYMCVGTHQGQTKASDLLEPEWQVVLRHQTWALGAKLKSSAGAGATLNYLAICQGQELKIMYGLHLKH